MLITDYTRSYPFGSRAASVERDPARVTTDFTDEKLFTLNAVESVKELSVGAERARYLAPHVVHGLFAFVQR